LHIISIDVEDISIDPLLTDPSAEKNDPTKALQILALLFFRKLGITLCLDLLGSILLIIHLLRSFVRYISIQPFWCL
jgi:hypothetical protein